MKNENRKNLQLFCLVLLSTLPFLASLLYFLPSNPPPYFMILIAFTKGFLFIAPFVLWKFLKISGNWKNYFQVLFAGNFIQQLIIGVAVGVLMSAVVLGSFEMLSVATREEALRRIALKISVLKIKEHFWIYGIVLSIVHSCLEEFYWRFFVLGAWKQHAPLLRAHVIAGLAFTLHHFTVTVHYFDFTLGITLGLGVWAAGLIWSYFYELEDSLLATWISHIIADMALIFIGFCALSGA